MTILLSRHDVERLLTPDQCMAAVEAVDADAGRRFFLSEAGPA
jgi:hypothetical protein